MKQPILIATVLLTLAGPAAAQPAPPLPPPTPVATTSGTAIVEIVEAEGTPAERRARFELVLSADGSGQVRTIGGDAEFEIKLRRLAARPPHRVDMIELDLRRSERRGKEMVTAQAALSWALRPGQRTVVARIAPPGGARLDVAVTVH